MRKLTYWASLVMIFVIPWENVLQWEGLGRVSRGAGMLVALMWVATVIVTGRYRRPQAFHLVMIVFVLWQAVSVFWTLDLDRTQHRLGTYLQLGFMVFILWDLYTTSAAVRSAMQAYVLGGFVTMAGLMNSYVALGGADYHRRVTIEGFNPNALGFILALGIPLAWYLALSRGRGLWPDLLRLLNAVYIPAAILSIFLTGSRAAMLGVGAGGLYMLATLGAAPLRMRVLVVSGVVCLALLAPAFVPATSMERLLNTSSAVSEGDLNGRMAIWREGLMLASQHPYVGVGAGAFKTAAVDSNKVAHNFVLSLTVEVGLIGFLLFALLLGMATRDALRHSPPFAKLWLTILLVWVLGASTHSWEHRKQTWLFLGLIVASARVTLREPGASRLPAFPVGTSPLPHGT